MKKAYIILIKFLLISHLAASQSVTLATTTLNPSKGTVFYNNGTNQLQYWNGTAWIPITNAATSTGWGASGNDIYNANAGNVGIGTTTPKATINISAGKTVLFGADSSGAGNKLIWYPSKGAFRAGNSFSSNWDYSNVGINSIAMGSYTTASGHYSTAMGQSTIASGLFSTAMGYQTIASGENSTALGAYNVDVSGAVFMVGVGISAFGGLRQNALTILGDGKIGIGTISPLATLHVSGTTILNGNVSIGATSLNVPLYIATNQSATEANTRYFSYGTGTSVGVLANGSYNISFLAEYDVVTKNSFVSAQTVTTSDSRIKNIIGISNNQQDLKTLQKIQITDYQYKDVATWGNLAFKKVIAQQVEEVYPQAVKKQTSTIPDIYSLAEKVVFDAINKKLTISMLKNYEIKIGDKIELIDEKSNKQLAEVESVDGKNFTVKNWSSPTDKIFVFGREVSDFRVVDYEAIAMLGISAIQQLAKENDELKLKVKQIESRLATRIEALEAIVLRPR